MNNTIWKTLSSNDVFHRFHFASSVLEGRFLIFAGGYGRNGVRLGSANIFDIHTHTCISLPDLPSEYVESQNCNKGAIFDNHFYVMGNFGKMIRLNLITRQNWETVIPMMRLQSVDAIISGPDGIFILGDSGQNNHHYEPGIDKYDQLPNIFTPRHGAAYAKVKDDIYVIGGFDWSKLKNLSSVEVFNTLTKKWRIAPPLPDALRNSSATVVERWIIVNGGHGRYHEQSRRNFVFDTLIQKWTQSDYELSKGRSLHQCLCFKDCEIASFGGLTGKQNCYCSFEIIHRKHIIPNWEVIKHYILLRHLVHDSRAFVIPHRTQESAEAKFYHNVMVTFIIDLKLDVFREILSFLIYN